MGYVCIVVVGYVGRYEQRESQAERKIKKVDTFKKGSGVLELCIQ